MLAPKRIKWRKQMKGRNRGLAKGGTEVSFGDYALHSTWLDDGPTDRSCCIAMTRYVSVV